MSDEPAQNGAPSDDMEAEEIPKPKSGEEAKAARSMNAMQANQEQTKSADIDDAKLATVRSNSQALALIVGNDVPCWWGKSEKS
jgi:hypothetical protein